MTNTKLMPRRSRSLTGAVLAAALIATVLTAAQDAVAQQNQDAMAAPVTALADSSVMRSPRFGRAVGEIFLANGVVWTYDRYIREGGENPVFRVGFNSWQDNLQTGWTWDDNSFSTNQIAHPYHGSLYYSAARSNGYSYWQSIPFAFGGSFLWEYFGETHNASMNDWIATSVGGVALGEILHRLATTVRDNRAVGSSRRWREVGAFALDPMGGLNRIIDGDWSRVYDNPEDRFPKNYKTSMDLGLRTRGEERLWEADTTDVYVKFEFDYGDPFYGDLGKPYDHFDFKLQLNFGDKTKVGRVTGSGNLAGVFVKESDKVNHIVGAYHRYEYINTNALEFGGQAVTGALMSQWKYDNGFELRSGVELGPMILAGATSDYPSVSGRTYDYGPGTAFVFDLELRRGAWTWAQLTLSHAWMHSISGNVADHHLFASILRLGVPVTHDIGLGAEFQVVNAERKYRDYEDVSLRNPQMRIFTSWGLN
jgi:hypothetical protein